MMNFRIVKAALVKLFGEAAAGRYKVIGYDSGGKAAEEVKGNNRLLQVYYQTGEFAKSAGRMYGDTQHGIKFGIILTVSAAAKVNLAVINNPAATSAQIKDALVKLKEAGEICDNLFDELADIVYQILMDTRNDNLLLEDIVLSNRWVAKIEKGEVLPKGELAVLDGVVWYTCSAVESVAGDTPVPVDGSGGESGGETGRPLDLVLDVVGDDVERTGLTITTS